MKTEEGKEECTKGCSTILYISPHILLKKVENSAVINKGICGTIISKDRIKKNLGGKL